MDSIYGAKEILILDQLIKAGSSGEDNLWSVIIYSGHADGLVEKFRTDKMAESAFYYNSGLLGRVSEDVVGTDKFFIRQHLVPIHG
jgi:hypothetical protein